MTDIDINNVTNATDDLKNKIVSEWIKTCDDKQLREVICDVAIHVNMLEK
jgi:hypothetical protein